MRSGPYIDLITLSDDLGSQRAPAADITQNVPPDGEALPGRDPSRAIKRRSKAKVFFHSCGNVYPLIADLIEIGVDVLNPVQVSAGDMGDTARLKPRIRQQQHHLLWRGGHTHRAPTRVDGRRLCEVRRRIRDLAPGGGDNPSSVHCIQPDVPPENVLAMFDEAMVAGKYPLAL